MIRKDFISNKMAILLGIVMPWLLVPITSFLSIDPPSAPIALFFLSVVAFFAIKFSLIASISSAISCFIIFAIFYTEPFDSLRIQEEEDVFTGITFLITAFFVGHLASRHNKYLQEIKLREKLSNIEIKLLDQLTQAIDQTKVLESLADALNQFSKDCQLVRITDLADIEQFLLNESTQHANNKNFSAEVLRRIVEWEEKKNIYILHDKKKVFAVLDMSSATISTITKDAFRLLMHQANIALERSRLIDDLAQEKIAKENELLRSALLSSISHDFRTPLTTMIGATSTVLEMGEKLGKSEVEELLTTVIAEAERLNRYTQNLLDMTRLGFGQLQLERNWISVEELVNVLNKRVKPLLQTIKLSVQIEPQLPLLNIHAALIEQALFNVVENAIKFSPPHSTIYLLGRMNKEGISILIADEGPGVPTEDRAKVFERFYTASRGDRRKSGSGLGLTICRGMINAHGGQVTIYNNAEKECQPLPNDLPPTGCCVKIDLPISTTVN